MKFISFYLPQFHEIQENNRAWGNGFTEWVNVKKAKPFFAGHRQPRVPIDDNYYNLLEEGVLKKQIELAKKYGLYGFCIYHYWFEGRMVLEKPVEKFFEDRTIEFHYCFAWANESWTRTWHGAAGNKEIMIAQTYGGKEEWTKHYEYFRKFFMDERYIKENNKPVLLIYRLKNIPRFNQMIKYWNELARADGFDGVYILSMNTCREHVDKSIWVNGSVDFEPNRTKNDLRSIAKLDRITKIDYSNIYKKMLSVSHKKHHYRTVFVDYDDSSRRGDKGIVTVGSNPAQFGQYLQETVEKSRLEGNDYVFINAWNEWGEGNYLEPDKDNGFRFLEEVKNVSKRN